MIDDGHVLAEGVELTGADFVGRTLVQFTSAGSRFLGCNFDRSRIRQASFGAGRTMSEYVDCTFDRSEIRFGPGGFARFERCSFRDADLRDWFCFAVEMIDCTLTGRLRGSVFNGQVPPSSVPDAGRSVNEFAGNDFSGMDLVDVDFRTGIDLRQQRLPTGAEYLYLEDGAGAVARARAQVVVWTDLEVRRLGLVFLTALERQVENGQQQLLLRTSNYPRAFRPAMEPLMSALTS